MKLEIIPAKLDKKSGSKKENGFADKNNFRIMKVGSITASAITARYYKGVSADGDNCVIIRMKNEKEK